MATGAAGEEALAAHLAKTCAGAIVLHDRRMPRSRANIDRTKLVDGLARQQEAVRAELAKTVPEMPVHACLCFLNPARQSGGSGLPLFGTPSINGFPLLYPRKLSKRLNGPGELSPASREEVAALLASAFPPA